jgi:hypothetical protein
MTKGMRMLKRRVLTVDNLERINQSYKNGKMNIIDIGWLIEELYSARDRISDLEGTAERWMKQSISDSEKLKVANDRIKVLEEGSYIDATDWKKVKKQLIEEDMNRGI